jgi:hypothetical protein
MATYRNRRDQLKAQSINSLLQGQSEAFNRQIINTELKKHCITMFAKEFDFDDADDLIGNINPVGGYEDKFYFHKSKLEEHFEKPETKFAIELKTDHPNIDYPSFLLDEARKKGRFIQFLEQAFEWQQLAYLFYSYFWASRPKWIEMMNRSEETDPNLSAFLQAGSVRVLIAVTPGYEHAVLHFIATREPWDGGPTPAIGDPLFIPLHEELRKQQDDLYNAVPEGEPWTFTLPTSLIYLEETPPPIPDKIIWETESSESPSNNI